jgi:hypothetical protein
LVVVVVIVVVLVIASVGFYLFLVPSPNVDVTYLYIYAPDDVCGLNTNPQAYYGFNATPGSAQPIGLEVENFNTSASCTVRGVLTNTSGFGVTSPQLPLTIPAKGNGTLNFTLDLPGSSYTGAVNLVFS